MLAFDKKIVIDRAFGYAKIKTQVPANNAFVHRIASISKTITKQSIFSLVASKQLDLDAKVFPLLNICCKENPKAAKITIRHLVTHTTGIWPTKTRESDPMFRKQNLCHAQLI